MLAEQLQIAENKVRRALVPNVEAMIIGFIAFGMLCGVKAAFAKAGRQLVIRAQQGNVGPTAMEIACVEGGADASVRFMADTADACVM